MSEASKPTADTTEVQIDLKDPLVAGVLAWLVPGLGHLYQGRHAKAAMFFIFIMGTFLYGLYLGSDSYMGWGRVVYLSFRENDLRLPYFCQVGLGLPTLPALIQAERMRSNKGPFFHALMAPPKLRPNDAPMLDDPQDPGSRTIHELLVHQPRNFELGTIYTMVAGLLNVLVIFDACSGPVPSQPARKEDDDKPKGESAEEGEKKS